MAQRTAMIHLARYARQISLALAIISLLGITVLIPAGVFFRYVLNNPVGWMEPIAAILLVSFTFFSATVTMADNLHVSVNLLVDKFSRKFRRINNNIANILLLWLLLLLAESSMELVSGTLNQSLPEIPQLPAAVAYIAVPIGFSLMAIIVLCNLVRQDFKTNDDQNIEIQLD